eukprot:TRINITY_DN7039_c0_g1_i1.p1 TRINITY_DN7039_c0_g1~~TRINITY_DN7039_c0_g1_i1.p1  ORF type:complete len:418 (-),score=114.56 TRINITY_DN7039_c0_g1_i1:184-1437(-)
MLTRAFSLSPSLVPITAASAGAPAPPSACASASPTIAAAVAPSLAPFSAPLSLNSQSQWRSAHASSTTPKTGEPATAPDFFSKLFDSNNKGKGEEGFFESQNEKQETQRNELQQENISFPNIHNTTPPSRDASGKVKNEKALDNFFGVGREAPPSAEARDTRRKAVFDSLFGGSQPDRTQADLFTEASQLYHLSKAERTKLEDLKHWEFYPMQVKKWLAFTKTEKGYYDGNGMWTSVSEVHQGAFNSLKSEQSTKSLHTWELQYTNEQLKLDEDLRGRFRFGIQEHEIAHLHPKIRRLFSFTFATEKEKLKMRKAHAITKWAAFPGDTANDAIQIDILTQRIRALTRHLIENRKDKHNKRTLALLMKRRKGLMLHFKKRNVEAYYAVLREIKLRDLYHGYPMQVLHKLPTKKSKIFQ